MRELKRFAAEHTMGELAAMAGVSVGTIRPALRGLLHLACALICLRCFDPGIG